MLAAAGKLGIAETAIPFLIFTPLWVAFDHEVVPAAAIAVAISLVFAVIRLVRREQLMFALSGAIGVGIAALFASTTGRAEDFFLPGILMNIGWAFAYVISIAVGKPLLGLFISQLTREGRQWYEDPEHRRLYTKASWIWVALFSFRVAVQLPLYLTDAVGLLAVARVITGPFLFAFALWLSYLVLRPLIPGRVRLAG